MDESKSFSASYEASYEACYDTTARIISTAVPVLLASIVYATGSAIAAGVGALILLSAYAYSPRGYAVGDGMLVVKRLIGNVRIPLAGIREARAAMADDLTGCIRLFGSGGLFGWYGLFRTSKLGRSTWYVTDRKHAVVLAAAEKITLVSPDDLDGFLAAIQRLAG